MLLKCLIYEHRVIPKLYVLNFVFAMKLVMLDQKDDKVIEMNHVFGNQIQSILLDL